MTSVILNTNAKVATMSSLELAALTNKRHDAVVTSIKKLFAMVNGDFVCKTTLYKDVTGRSLPMLAVCESLANLFLAKSGGLARVPTRLQEEAALKTIEQLLGLNLIRQFPVLSYRIDGYCAESNTAYEIDEPGHRYTSKKDAMRQQEIESAIGCKFVRISL